MKGRDSGEGIKDKEVDQERTRKWINKKEEEGGGDGKDVKIVIAVEIEEGTNARSELRFGTCR